MLTELGRSQVEVTARGSWRRVCKAEVGENLEEEEDEEEEEAEEEENNCDKIYQPSPGRWGNTSKEPKVKF